MLELDVIYLTSFTMKLLSMLLVLAALSTPAVAQTQKPEAAKPDINEVIARSSECQAVLLVQARVYAATAISLATLIDNLSTPEAKKATLDVASGVNERSKALVRIAANLDMFATTTLGPQGGATYRAAVVSGVRQRLESRAPSLLGLDGSADPAEVLVKEEKACAVWLTDTFAQEKPVDPTED